MYQRDRSWWKDGEDSVLQTVGLKPLQTYIDIRQETVADWVSTRHIFEVCAQETGYEVGGRR